MDPRTIYMINLVNYLVDTDLAEIDSDGVAHIEPDWERKLADED